jgi:hypothetical protein
MTYEPESLQVPMYLAREKAMNHCGRMHGVKKALFVDEVLVSRLYMLVQPSFMGVDPELSLPSLENNVRVKERDLATKVGSRVAKSAAQLTVMLGNRLLPLCLLIFETIGVFTFRIIKNPPRTLFWVWNRKQHHVFGASTTQGFDALLKFACGICDFCLSHFIALAGGRKTARVKVVIGAEPNQEQVVAERV